MLPTPMNAARMKSTARIESGAMVRQIPVAIAHAMTPSRSVHGHNEFIAIV